MARAGKASRGYGARVRRFRREADLTQESVAAAMRGLGHETWSRETVSQVENGHRGVLIDEAVDLARCFHPSSRVVEVTFRWVEAS